jgi:quercetin dioxygenase-like cupin family protein
MLKWQKRKSRGRAKLSYGPFDARARACDTQVQDGMRRRLVFEDRTAYLNKLHCHVSTLAPQAGYAPHKDPYDVIIVVLEGEVETLERCAGPHSVIFYAAGEPHGLRNPSQTHEARYVVFELHG